MGVLRAGLNKWAKVFAGLLGLQTSGKEAGCSRLALGGAGCWALPALPQVNPGECCSDMGGKAAFIRVLKRGGKRS